MQKNQLCKASAVAQGNVQCDDREKVKEPDDEQQLRSSIDQRSCRLDPRVASAASSNSGCESTSVAQPSPHDTQDSDRGARRSLLAPAEIRSRPRITKASVWFLRTTSLFIPISDG